MYFIEISLASNHRLILRESKPMRHHIIMFTTTSLHISTVENIYSDIQQTKATATLAISQFSKSETTLSALDNQYKKSNKYFTHLLLLNCCQLGRMQGDPHCMIVKTTSLRFQICLSIFEHYKLEGKSSTSEYTRDILGFSFKRQNTF